MFNIYLYHITKYMMENDIYIKFMLHLVQINIYTFSIFYLFRICYNIFGD